MVLAHMLLLMKGTILFHYFKKCLQPCREGEINRERNREQRLSVKGGSGVCVRCVCISVLMKQIIDLCSFFFSLITVLSDNPVHMPALVHMPCKLKF